MGGGTDTIDTYAVPQQTGAQYAQDAVDFVKNYNLDGVDFDLELAGCWCNGPLLDGSMMQFVTEATNTARNQLPSPRYIVSHAPLAGYISSWAGAGNGYRDWMLEHGDKIDFLAIQYYNHNTYTVYDQVFRISPAPYNGAAIKELIDAGIPSEKLVVGKLLTNYAADGINGHIEPDTLKQWGCQANEDVGFRGGFMTWMYRNDELWRSEQWSEKLFSCPVLHENDQCSDSAFDSDAADEESPEVIVNDENNVDDDEIDNSQSSNENNQDSGSDETVSDNQDNGNCIDIGDASESWGTWTDGSNTVFYLNINYQPSSNNLGKWHLIATFSQTIDKIIWWEWEPSSGGISVIPDTDRKVWKLEGYPAWFEGKAVEDISPQVFAQGPGLTQTFQYCLEGQTVDSSGEINSQTSGSDANDQAEIDDTPIAPVNVPDIIFQCPSPTLGKTYPADNIQTIGGSPIQNACASTATSSTGSINPTCQSALPSNWAFTCSTRGNTNTEISGICRPDQTTPLQSNPNPTEDNDKEKQGGHDYNQALHLSLYFYEANQGGILPSWNRVPWRNHANLYDGCDVPNNDQTYDLTGGWYDAGDNMKFHHPMAQAAVALFWGGIDFADGWNKAGEMQNLYNNLDFITRYFIKTHPEENVYIGQVGHGTYDHNHYARPEQMHNQCRPVWKCDPNHPCTEPAAETAAALAAASIFFKRNGDETLADLAYNKAISLMNFADSYRGQYHESVTDAYTYYKSWGGFYDELCDGWAWLARAHDEYGNCEQKNQALDKAMSIFNARLKTAYVAEYSWDEKSPSAFLNLAILTNEDEVWAQLDIFVDSQFVNRQQTTTAGYPYVNSWGSNRYAANLAMIGALAVKKHNEMNRAWSSTAGYNVLDDEQVLRKSKYVANYVLGTNPLSQSYVVGYGDNYPVRPHHKAATCPAWGLPCSWNEFGFSGENPHILYGAVVGGPSQTDQYNDDRQDYFSNEVTTDYNSGFTTLVAGLKELL